MMTSTTTISDLRGGSSCDEITVYLKGHGLFTAFHFRYADLRKIWGDNPEWMIKRIVEGYDGDRGVSSRPSHWRKMSMRTITIVYADMYFGNDLEGPNRHKPCRRGTGLLCDWGGIATAAARDSIVEETTKLVLTIGPDDVMGWNDHDSYSPFEPPPGYDPEIDGNGRTSRADEDPAAEIPTDCDADPDTSARLSVSCEAHAFLHYGEGLPYWDADRVGYTPEALARSIRQMPVHSQRGCEA